MRFWQRPRGPGIGIENRTVGFLELFYDLVYVVLIAAAAHRLAHHMSWSSVGEFIVVFSLIWIAWLNGSAYHDLHGREDIRSRVFIFVQMLLVVLLAVYAGDGTGGRDWFSILYGTFLVVIAWLWYTVHVQAGERYQGPSRLYLAVLLIMAVAMVGSAFAPPSVHLPIWTSVVSVWLATGYFGTRAVAAWNMGSIVSDSFVERFGLFTIIVLGEVVVGVVQGMSISDRSVDAVVTGVLALGVGFGLWWTYFDLVGRRMPKEGRNGLPVWIILHLPLTMAIAAGGAALASVIEHADTRHVPDIAAWVLSGSVALALVTIAAMVRTLANWGRYRFIYLPASISMIVLAAGSATLALLRPGPIVLTSTLVGVLAMVWFVYAFRGLKEDQRAARAEHGSRRS